MLKEVWAIVGILAALQVRLADAGGCRDRTPVYSPLSFPSEGCWDGTPLTPFLPVPPPLDQDFAEKTTYEYYEDLSVDDTKKSKTVEYATAYPGQDDEFKEMCEEMWACSQYFSQYVRSDQGQQSLCFGKLLDQTGPLGDDVCIYPYSSDEDKAYHNARKQFVVENCYGGATLKKGRPLYKNFTSCVDAMQDCSGETPSLQEVKEEVCAEAEELSFRKTFSPINETACNEIIDCVLGDLAKLSTDAQKEIDKDLLKYDLCQDEDNDGNLKNEKEKYCDLTAATCGEDYPIPQGSAPSCGVNGNPALPTCPDKYNETFADFGPGYPDPDVNDYKAAIASIQGTFISCPEDRTNSLAYGIVLSIKYGIEISLIAVKNVMDGLPDSAVNVAVYIAGALETVVIALDAVIAQADYHDGIIDGAEIEAFYENTRQLLDGSAAIYDEVVCRCAEEPRRGHGCDSIDNDCDQTVDECDEDVFPPEIDIGQALCQCGSGTGCGGGQKWYLDDKDPEACVESSIVAADDCDPLLEVNTTLFGTCFDSYVQIETKDRCNNTAATKTVGVWIDKEDPKPTCHFGKDTTKKVLVLDDTGQGQQKNVNLQYDASDNCSGDLKVNVEVYANEIEDFQSQEMALMYRTQGDDNEKAGLYVATTICQTLNNGQCVQDPNAKVGGINKDFRIYTVVVTAEDPSGRTDKDECKIVIAPQTWNTPDVPEDLSKSTQRFFLTSHDSVFRNTGPKDDEDPPPPTIPASPVKANHRQKAKFDK